MGLLVGVVYTRDQDVFEREPLFLATGVVVTSGKQCLDVVLAIDWHDLVAHFIGRGVQRNREANLQWFVGKFLNLGRQTAGRDGNVSRANAESPRRVNDSNRAHHVAKVGKRFTHSHENDVVDLLTACALNRDDLIDNFVRAQVAGKSFQTACTKFAAVSAPDLRGEANCPPIRAASIKRWRRWNQNSFD